MQFNPEDYETVKSRKEKFYKDYPDGRITVELINSDATIAEHALFKATVYLTQKDQADNTPRSTGYAYEMRDTELSVSSSGKKYESVNYTSWTENAEESAVGRALDNAGYSGNKKCSREEMEKATRMTTTMNKYNKKPTDEEIDEIMQATAQTDQHICPEHHVEMTLKSKKGNLFHKEGNQICIGKGYFEAKK